MALKNLGVEALSGRLSKHSYTITFGGDTSLGDFYMKWNGEAVYRRLCQNPMCFTEAVRPLVADSDIFIANLETCLIKTEQSPFKDNKLYLGWDDPDRTLDVLKKLGVTGVNLANNHALDFGGGALLQGILRLREAGIKVFGAGQDRDAASQPLIERIDLNGSKRLLYVIGGFEIRRRYAERYHYYAAPSSPGVNQLHRVRLMSQIQSIRAEDPAALIIVCPHWFLNYGWVMDWQMEFCSSLVSAGADLVIGHGPHMLGACHWSGVGTQIPSLGNFVFNSPGGYEKFSAPPYSLVARLEIYPEIDGWSSSLKLYPIITDNRRTDFRAQPIDPAILPTVYSLLENQARETSSFTTNFEPNEDERGPLIRLKRPISPRFVERDASVAASKR